MRLKAPENCNEANVGDENFQVDDTGHIEVPEGGVHLEMLLAHGFSMGAQPDTQAAEENGATTQRNSKGTKGKGK